MYVLLSPVRAPRIVSRKGFYRKPMTERVGHRDWVRMLREAAAVERRMELFGRSIEPTIPIR